VTVAPQDQSDMFGHEVVVFSGNGRGGHGDGFRRMIDGDYSDRDARIIRWCSLPAPLVSPSIEAIIFPGGWYGQVWREGYPLLS
jgi:hypothetical protein